jgi:hypothetical protein
VPPERRHSPLLDFVSRASGLTSKYSRESLLRLRERAEREFPAYTRLIEAYLDLLERAETDAQLKMPNRGQSEPRTRGSVEHLFDLLRSKKLFPTNLELADFAGRVLPGMNLKRLSKVSRGEIAARIIEYLETLDSTTKRRLEESMRDAVISGRAEKRDRNTFFSKWEKIIKGIEF